MGVRAAWKALFETKVSAAGPLLAIARTGQPVFTPRRFDRLAEEGFQRNVIAYRAVTEVARGVASVPWQLFRPLSDGRAEIDEHPLLDLVKRPNPQQAGSEFFEAVTGFYLLAGNSYIEAVRPERSGAPPQELWPLRPDRMRIVAAETGLPQAYEYSVAGQTQRWDANPITGESVIRQLKTFHPLDDFYGLSPIEAAATSIDQHNEQGKWNVALLQHSAEPSGALVYKPTSDGTDSLTDDQFARLQQQIEQKHAGSRNAGRPIILEGGLDWKQMGLSPKDMDFLNAKNTSARDIALAFGVPPQLLGIPGDNTYCLPGYARVSTPEGAKPIQSISIGDEVWSFVNGEQRRCYVTRAGKTGHKMVYRVKMRGRTLEATDNHPVLVRRDGGDIFVKVGDLKKGDEIVSVDRVGIDEALCPHSVADMELYGFYTGNGSASGPVSQADDKGYRRGAVLQLAIDPTAPHVPHYSKSLASAALRAGSPRSNPGLYGRAICVSSSPLYEQLGALGLLGTAHEKRVPQWILTTPEAHRLAYLRGYLDSDGSVDNNGRAVFGSVSRELIFDFWHLALSLGLQVGAPGVLEREATLPNGATCNQTLWWFQVSRADDVARIGTNTLLYQDRIALNRDKPRRRRPARVWSIEPIREMDVYDIEVAASHNFIAEGVVVHNSNYQEARLALWEETIVPLLRHIRDEMNGWLVPMFGDGLELDVDLDEVPALTLRRERKFEMIQQSDFLTINEKREALGFDRIETGGDVLLVPANMIPLGEEPEDEDEPAIGGIDEDEASARYRIMYGDDPQKPKLVSASS